MDSQPSKWALKFLRWFCREDYLDEIEGDLIELFEKRFAASPKTARRRFTWDVVKSFRLRNLKSINSFKNSNIMNIIRHTLLLAFRNFRKYKSAFLINLIGLSTGLACTLLIYLWVNDELNVDKFHVKNDRLYQVMTNNVRPDGIVTWNGTSALLPDALLEELPEVEMTAGGTDPDWQMSYDLFVNEERKGSGIGKFVDENYFKMFSYALLQGNPEEVLTDISSVVISERLALRLFNRTENVVGQTIVWKDINLQNAAKITGIFKDPPANSTDQFDFVLPFSLYKYAFGADWKSPNAVTYVLLQDGTSPDAVNAKLANFMDDKVEESDASYFLHAYADNYLYGQFENGVQAGGRIEYVRLFSIIALFILVISCVNFMNLSTARASRRLKEVGVKKAVGASRSALITQYLGESILMAFIALLVAIGLVVLFLPQFNVITGKDILFHYEPTLVITALSITLFTGLVSGSYPALYLSGFNAIAVLKGQLKGSIGELWVRKGLVVFQFASSVILIVVVLVVYQQMEFVQNKNLGYEKDNVLLMKREGKAAEGMDAFLDGIRNIPGIINGSAITNDIFNAPGAGDFQWEGQIDGNTGFSRFLVHYDFVETLGLELVAGRSFSREFAQEESQIILNETAAEIMGFDDPVGKSAKLWGNDVRIVGVIKDFHFKSLHERMGPMFLLLDSQWSSTMVIRVQSGGLRQTLDRLEAFYAEFNPGYFADYKFLDQEFQTLYEAETRVAKLSRYFAGFAVLISCLGLFGLAAFTAERRMKEIGIRKILGSGLLSIVRLLSRDFTQTVILAIIIALPTAFFISKNWLDNFEYRITLEWWTFAGAGALGLLIAWFTVSLQIFKAARVNPALCLRDE